MASVLSHKTNLDTKYLMVEALAGNLEMLQNDFSYGQTEVETAATLVNYM